MISPADFQKMLVRLFEKSRVNAVNWRKGGNEDNFYVAIDDAVQIYIYFNSPTSSPDYALARLVVDGKVVVELGGEETGNNQAFYLVRSLYHDARRSFYNWDDALQKLDAALNSDDPIGTPEARPPDDDIPF